MFAFIVRPLKRLSLNAFAVSLSLTTALSPVVAAPVGGQVTAGVGVISQSGPATVINQSSDRLIVEWQSFDTIKGETVTFLQPGSSAWALNRILSGQATQFDGSLFANGNVVITNGSGIHFGKNAFVDVGSLIATTSGISDQNFLSGNLIFDQPGNPEAMVTNAGSISVKDSGLAALVAPGVENSGYIQANLGTVILGAGEAHTIDFYGDGLVKFTITEPTKSTPKRADGSDADGLVNNSGTVKADGGTILMTAAQASNVLDNAINMSGIAQANSVSTRNGKIVLGGGSGRVKVSGNIIARSAPAKPLVAPIPATRGGTIHVTGDVIEIASTAEIDASGANGGGEILIGGALKGGTLSDDSQIGYVLDGDKVTLVVGENAGAEGLGYIQRARVTTVAEGAEIDARATESGDGGSAIIWGADEVNFHGAINTLGGNNGFVEVSTKGTGVIDGIAQTGHMLVDPGDVCIFLSTTAGCAVDATGVTFGTITSVLNNGGLFELNTEITGTIGTGRVDFGGGFPLTINNNSGTVGTFEIHAADTIDTNQVVIQNNGNSGTNFEWYAGSSETNNAVTSADIILGPQDLDTGGGYAYFEAADDILISDPVLTGGGDATFIARGGDGGSSIVIGAQGNRSDDHIDTTDGAGNAGAITFQTDSLTIDANAASLPGLNAVIDAEGVGGIVTIRSTTNGRTINLGTADANSLSITDSDIDRIAAEVLRIGGFNAGNITITDAISPAQTDTLSLITAGAILDGNATDPDITVANLAMQADSSIGSNDFLETAVSRLAVRNDDGPMSISNTGALTIGTVDGVSGLTSGGAVEIETASPITIAADITTAGNITATAGESGTTDTDHLTLNAGVNFASTGGNVTLQAGDDVVLGNNAGIFANGTLTLTAGFNDIDNDGGISAGGAFLVSSSINLSALDDIALGLLQGGTVDITSTNGAIVDGNDVAGGLNNIVAQSLSLSANTGIGGTGAAATLETQVSNLEAQTDTGGIFLSNSRDLTIGGVTAALNGVRVATAGDIQLTNQGRIDINVAGDRVKGPDAVTITAIGATADILTGDNATILNATVESTGGTVTLSAGQDLLLGDPAGAGTLGNVFGGGSVVLDAGRDITVDTGTFVLARGAGTITANAGRNISVLNTSGPFNGAKIRTEGGDITLTTGVGGVFTTNNGASPAVQTTDSGGNGNITINADAADIQNSISAGTGIVTLQSVTNGQSIDLGTETAGSLSLTDAELDQIAASVLRIGSTNAGSITVSNSISPANTGTLSLTTGDQIVDGNAAGADITVTNLAMQAANGIGSADALDLGVGTVAANNSTTGSIGLFQLTGLGDLTVGTVDGVVGINNQATTGLSQTRIQTQASNLIINNDVSSALDALLVGAGGLLDNNAAISTTAGFGIDLQASSMALEGGTITAGQNGRVRISPLFAGQEIDLGSTSDAGAALELSDAELDTITAGVLQIGQSGIDDITITDEITLTDVDTLSLQTSGAIVDGTATEQTDLAVNNLVTRSGNGVTGLDIAVTNLAFANAAGAVNFNNTGALTIAAVDGQSTSRNIGTTTDISTTGDLTFAANTASTGDAAFTAPTISVNNGVDVDTEGALAFNADTVNLDGDLDAATGISGTASTVNVIGSTGGAEIQDGVDVAAAGATVNVGDGGFGGGITVDKALTLLGDGYSNTTIVNVADNDTGMNVIASGVTIDGFRFVGDGSPVDATGVKIDSSASAVNTVLVGDSADADVLGNQFTGLTTGLSVTDGGSGNGIDIDVGVGNVFDNSTTGMVFDGADIDIVGDTLNNTAFANLTGDYITLANGAVFAPGNPTVLDATGVSYDGLDLSVAANALNVESKLTHYLDNPTLGLINTGALAVNSGNSIQLAVNAAGFIGGAQTVSVGAGTFGGSVEVWVDNLTLQGLGATTIIDADAVDAFANNGDVNNGFDVVAESGLSGGGNVSGVTIDGFRFTSAAAGSNIGIELGEAGVSTAINTTIQNNSFDDLNSGIVAQAVSSNTTISNATMTNIDQQGVQFNSALSTGDVVLVENSNIVAGVDGVRFSSTLTAADVTIAGSTIEGSGDGIEFAGAIRDGSEVTIEGNQRVEGRGIVADEDGLGDGIAFRGAISGATTIILVDDNTLIRGGDRGINFADSSTGGPATINDASVTISRNDEIRGTSLDGILFNADLTNATIMIGGATTADANGLIIGDDEGVDIENVIGGSFTIANNTLIEGLSGDAVEFEGLVSNGADVNILDNTTLKGNLSGVVFEATVGDSTVNILENNEVSGDVDGIYFSERVTDSFVNINGNTDIIGRNGQGILFDSAVVSSDVAIGTAASGNGRIVGGENGIVVVGVRNGSLRVANNAEIRGENVDGISLTRGRDTTIEIIDNDLISGDGFDGIYVDDALVTSDFTVADNNQITGADDGMNIGSIVGGSVNINNNDQIRGIAGSGIEFDALVNNGASLNVTGNSEIRGGEEGIEFDGNVDDSTVRIADNPSIIGETTDGILFGNINNSIVDIIDNTAVTGLFGSGIQFAGNVVNGSTVTVDNNDVVAGLGAGIFIGDLANIGGTRVSDSTINITRNGDESIPLTGIGGLLGGIMSTSRIVNGSTLAITDNEAIAGGLFGINLVEDIVGNSEVRIANNGVIFGGLIAGIHIGSFLYPGATRMDGSTLTVENNDLITSFLGDGFASEMTIENGSTVNILENPEISGDVDGIYFGEEITDSFVNINGNMDIIGRNNQGILLNDLVISSDIAIGTAASGNGRIVGGENGIAVAPVLGGSLKIVNNTEIRGENVDGISLIGGQDTTIEIIDNDLISGDGFDGIYVDDALVTSDFTVADNNQIIGADDGMNIGFIIGGSVNINDNDQIRGIAGSGIEFDALVNNGASLNVTGNSEIRGGEEGIEFDGNVEDSTVKIADNTSIIGETTDGILFNDVSGSEVTISNNMVTGGVNGFSVNNNSANASASRFVFDRTVLTGGTGAGLSVVNGSGIPVMEIDLLSLGGNVFTGAPSMLLSGAGLSLAGNTLGDTAFNSVAGGNFIELANGGLFEPGRPTIINGDTAIFDGASVIIGGISIAAMIEARIIDFDDNNTLGQIFFRDPTSNEIGVAIPTNIRITNIQAPGDHILRPDDLLQILPEGVFGEDYKLGDCSVTPDEETGLVQVQCIVQPGNDISPFVVSFLAKLPLGDLASLN